MLLDQGSKKEISDACGVSKSTLSNMRKAKRRYESDPEFALRVGRPLMETSWGIMLLAGHKRGPGEDVMDLEERADDLARTIRSRLTDLLKRDPVVTAHSLAKYDRRLPKMLTEVWSGRMVLPGARNLTMPEMKKQAEMLRQRAVSIDAMLAKFEEGKEERLLEAAERETEQEERKHGLWFPSLAEDDEWPKDEEGNIRF